MHLERELGGSLQKSWLERHPAYVSRGPVCCSKRVSEEIEMAATGVDHPRVSVIVAAFNVEAYIARAIRSVQAQTMASLEIMVSDDHSGDQTCSIVEGFARQDSRIRLLRTNVNGGVGSARNRAIDAARGTWIAVLDADDTWKPERLERLIDVAEASNCAIVADNYLRLDDSTGLETGAAFYEPRPVSSLTASRLLHSEHPFGRVRFGLLKPLVRRQFLERRGIRYATEIHYAEDFHFLMRVLLEGGAGVLVSDPYYVYTLPQSLRTGANSQGTRTRTDLADRIWIADDLIERYRNDVQQEVLTLLQSYRGWMVDIAAGKATLELWRRGDRWPAIASALAKPVGALSYAVTSPTVKRLRAHFQRGIARAPV